MKQNTTTSATIFPEPFYYLILNVSGVKGSNLSLLKNLFSNGEGGLKSSFEKGFAIRQHGWDLELRQEFRINLHGIESENRLKRIQVLSNGTLIVQGALISDFLCWGSGQIFGSPEEEGLARRIHPLALIEFTYDTVIAYRRILKEIDKSISIVRCTVGFAGLEIDKYFLVDGSVGPRRINSSQNFWKGGESEFPIDFNHEEFVVEESDLNRERQAVGEITFKIISGVYRMFGFSEEAIPYVAGEDTKKRISYAEIISVE